jgi:hypothetical protein
VGTIFFSFLLFYIALFLRFYSHVAGAGVASMLWCMKDYKRHAAQLLEYLAFFSRVVLFRSVTRMAGDSGKAGMIFRLWLCKRKAAEGRAHKRN